MDLTSLMKELQQRRDELKLQLHLASKEAEDEWTELQADWDKFLSKSEFDKSAEEVGEAARSLGLKMKAAYDRMKKAT
ncbi:MULTISPECIES: hypothetical protein [unclassified Ruegeria]|uniref:hypothetical protein n=1 Tax=unclassified Ruegeria TaxID=2625375 RepID=UPI00149248CA|nr:MULTISPECIES: hypothetical protein [unclassified Ruegeria]NOD34838.1 hypothetical protein [Ruegeria sp. HKCCD7296]NOE41690.1 hypothetical protein [Ruegeria sp. HKCCD7319]